jgi:hypothetical protein
MILFHVLFSVFYSGKHMAIGFVAVIQTVWVQAAVIQIRAESFVSSTIHLMVAREE